MRNENGRWHFSRQVNLSVVVQITLLAGLIIGTWVNLQRQLCLLQHDIGLLIATQQKFQDKIESLNNVCISYEYRLQAMENKQSEN
jgi:hypothetical protein